MPVITVTQLKAEKIFDLVQLLTAIFPFSFPNKFQLYFLYPGSDSSNK